MIDLTPIYETNQKNIDNKGTWFFHIFQKNAYLTAQPKNPYLYSHTAHPPNSSLK
jgi:hypothetical protein